MSLLSVYQDICGQAGTWKAKSSSPDAYGLPTFSAAVSIDLIFSRKQKVIKNGKGEEELSEAQALVSVAVGVGDLITYGGTEYEVKAIDEAPPIVTSDVMSSIYF